MNFKLFTLLFLCLLIPIASFSQKKTKDKIVYENGKKYYLHIVKKGETIYGIAEKFKVKTSDIVLENPSAIDGVKQGDKLKIPVLASSKANDTLSKADKQGNYIFHQAEEKETLYSLAKKYNTTISTLDSLNPELKLNGLKKGQTIRIPKAKLHAAENNVNNKEAEAYKYLISDNGNATKDTAKKLGRYNIALILPFAPETSDTLQLSMLLDQTEQIPFTTKFSVDFYNGLKLALDSLSKKGLMANLHVYNISASSDSSSCSIDSILKRPEMAKMNLIIGPPYPANFKKMAIFAAKYHIPVVSPLSGESSVLKANPYTSKATPSTLTETETTANFIAKNYQHATIIIVHNRFTGDETYYGHFKSRLKEAMVADSNNDSVYTAEYSEGLSILGNKLSGNMVNIVVVPYMGTSFVAKFLNQFANSSYAGNNSTVLFGMHNWAAMDALDITNLDTLQFHFPSNEFVNYNDSATEVFIMKYRGAFQTDPDYYSCQGFDIGMFYGALLNQFGTGLQNHLGDIKYKGVQTSFNMVRLQPTDGYENRAVYILLYKNYSEAEDLRSNY